MSGCGATVIAEAVDGGGSGGGTHPLDNEERCGDKETAGCRRGPAEIGDTFTGDDWTVRYRGADVERSETGDPTNPAQLLVYAYVDITNEGDEPRSLTGYNPEERFEASLASGRWTIDPCDSGEQIPSDGAIAPGETLTLQLCFGNRGLPDTFEGESQDGPMILDLAEGQAVLGTLDRELVRFEMFGPDGASELGVEREGLGSSIGPPRTMLDEEGDILLVTGSGLLRCARSGCDELADVPAVALQWSLPPERSARLASIGGCDPDDVGTAAC